MWHITDDFWDEWRLLKEMFWRCELWQNHVSAGNYPDCDMLTLGTMGKGFGHERKTNFTPDEERTMLTLWNIFGSPLMIGGELTLLDKDTLGRLTNRDILEMNKPWYKPVQIVRNDDCAVWAAVNAHDDHFYVAMFNLSDNDSEVSCSKEELRRGLASKGFTKSLSDEYVSLWDGRTFYASKDTLSAQLAAHACIALKSIPKR